MVNVVQAYEVVRINKRRKEVKPDGHGEASSRPQAIPTQVGFHKFHDGHPLVHLL